MYRVLPQYTNPAPTPITNLVPIPRVYGVQILSQTHTHQPQGNHVHQTPHTFSQNTTRALNTTIQNAWASATLRSYSRTVQHFLNFCTQERVPPSLQFPADEFVLCAYAASESGSVAVSTVLNRLSGLRAWHLANNAPWNASTRLQVVINGVKNMTPASSIRPPRPPVSVTMLRSLLASLNLSIPLDAAVAACATVSFWCQCRLGELLSSTKHDVSTSSRPSRAHLYPPRTPNASYTLFIPQTKTHRHGQHVMVSQYDPSCDPIHYLTNHFRVNAIAAHLPIFAFRLPDGSVHNLTKHTFIHVCDNIWQRHGFPRTFGHSFRIGGTTELLSMGVAPDIVKTLGRWSSDAYLRYWRNIDVITLAQRPDGLAGLVPHDRPHPRHHPYTRRSTNRRR